MKDKVNLKVKSSLLENIKQSKAKFELEKHPNV